MKKKTFLTKLIYKNCNKCLNESASTESRQITSEKNFFTEFI